MAANPDPIDVTIGARVASRRKAVGLNQTQLGKAIGVTFQQVQKYEKGTNRIAGSTLVRIAETLGVDPGYFFPEGGPDSAPNLSPSDQLGASRGGHELARLFVQMGPDRRDSLLSVARVLAGPSAGELVAMAGA